MWGIAQGVAQQVEGVAGESWMGDRDWWGGFSEQTLCEGVAGWQIVWRDEVPAKPGQRISKKRVAPPLQALGFTLDELREARLAPVVDFKGRKPKDTPTAD